MNCSRAAFRLYEIKSTAKESEGSGDRFGSGSSSGLQPRHSPSMVGGSSWARSTSIRVRRGSDTELGLVVADSTLASGLTRFFDVEVPALAYEIRLNGNGTDLVWIERTAAGEKRYDVEPESTWAARTAVEMLSILPIDWML